MLCFLAAILSALPAAAAGPSVAVFNFQITSNTPEWTWLEKGLGPWRLVWAESHLTRSDAIRRERRIKAMKPARWIREHLLNR